MKAEFWGLFTFLSREEKIRKVIVQKSSKRRKSTKGGQQWRKVNGVGSSRKSENLPLEYWNLTLGSPR